MLQYTSEQYHVVRRVGESYVYIGELFIGLLHCVPTVKISKHRKRIPSPFVGEGKGEG